MNIKEYFKNKRNVATFILIITVILTLFIATSNSKYVLEKELKFNLDIIESEEWNKRTLITGEELNEILLSSEATQVVFGYENDYLTEIEGIEGTAVGFVSESNEAKSFKADDIKLYTVTDTENIKTAYILSEYQIKANADSSKMFYNYELLTNAIFSNFETSIVENMDSMFYGCTGLTVLDLYKFDTAKVTNIASMFYNCNLLETIYVSELWNLDGIATAQENVFLNCENLAVENGTVYDPTKISSDYACIDSDEKAGYFTYKSIDTEEQVTFNLVRPNVTENTTTTNTSTNTNTTTSNENETTTSDSNNETNTDEQEKETGTETETNTNTENGTDTETDANTDTNTDNNNTDSNGDTSLDDDTTSNDSTNTKGDTEETKENTELEQDGEKVKDEKVEETTEENLEDNGAENTVTE